MFTRSLLCSSGCGDVDLTRTRGVGIWCVEGKDDDKDEGLVVSEDNCSTSGVTKEFSFSHLSNTCLSSLILFLRSLFRGEVGGVQALGD